MKAFGFAALLIALAAPAGAQQTQQSNQPRQDTAAGAAQDPGQGGRTTPNDATSNDRTSTSPSQQNRASQGDQGAAATSGQDDRGLGGAADQNRSELPATASALPALGVFGLLSFAGAALVRRLRTREL